MTIRIGKVTKVYPGEGRVKVTFEDSGSSSLPLAMLTMNKEYSMPGVGDRVVTMHMENGTSKGFVLGTYYGGGTQPRTSAGYRKDFTAGCYATCKGGAYTLTGQKVTIQGGGAAGLTLAADTVLKAETITIEADNLTFQCAYGTIAAEELMKRLERIEDQLGLPHTI